MWLDFKITDRCNNNCTYCFDKHINPKGKEKLDTKIIINCLNQSIESGFKNIALFGGEPSLRADLKNILDSLILPVVNDITLFFISNGINFKSDIISSIFGSKFKNVVYVQSIDSFKMPNYKNQNVKKTLDTIFTTKSLCDKYQNSFHERKVEIHSVVSRENINDIYHIVDFFHTHSIEVGLGLVTPSFFVETLDIEAEFNKFTFSEIESIIHQLELLESEQKLNPTNQLFRKFLELYPKGKTNTTKSCKVNTYKTMINSDGCVYRCLFESYLGVNSYGNILTDDFSEILKRIRNDNDKTECIYKNSCWDYFTQHNKK